MRSWYRHSILFVLFLQACMPGTAAPAPGAPVLPTLASSPVPAFPGATAAPSRIEVADGYTLETVATGLDLPTQMIVGPDGDLWLAQLAGRETAGEGQVVAVSPQTGAQRLLLDKLLTPTGIAVTDDALWIASVTQILRAPLDGENQPGKPEVVLDELPNVRSAGTLTLTPDDRLLYATAAEVDLKRTFRSGSLWVIGGEVSAEAPRKIASGFMTPYTHMIDPAGNVWVLNITDEVREEQPVADAIVVFPYAPEVDTTVPCLYYTEPVPAERDRSCGNIVTPAGLLPAHTTPISIVPAPWAPDHALISAWVAGTVTEVTRDPATGLITQTTTVLSGIDRAQHLLVWEDGTVLVGEFTTGTIYRLRKSAATDTSVD